MNENIKLIISIGIGFAIVSSVFIFSKPLLIFIFDNRIRLLDIFTYFLAGITAILIGYTIYKKFLEGK